MSKLLKVQGTKLDKRAGDVIFVHGLDGDARKTWEINKTFWPEWLAADLTNVGGWSLDYDAASLAWKGTAMPLVDRATNVLDLCSSAAIGGVPVVFIAHSLGGLLVKQLLRTAKEYNNPAWLPLALNTRGIVFLATPHAGSDKAGWVKPFGALLRPNVTVDELLAHASQLRDLNVWYRNNARSMGIDTRVYFETRVHRGLCIIVDQTSADPGIPGVFPIPIDCDHVGICKLDARDDQRYSGILNFTRERLKVDVSRSPSTVVGETDILSGLPTRWAAQVDAFLLQYLGSSGSPVPFGGRQNHLQTLTDWLEGQSAPQYGLLTARAGLGKSALLAHWVDGLRRKPIDYGLIYFPISARWQTNSENAVFQSLAFRLATLFGEPAPETEDVRELREVVRGYLTRAVEQSRRLLLVLDGLDEATGWQVGTDFLPPRSRGNVRALIAARWNIKGVAAAFPLSELNLEQVADILRQSGGLLAALADRLNVAEVLFEKSNGDPLLISLYINELEKRLDNPESFDKDQLRQIDPGLQGFFQYWFADQEQIWGENRHDREPGVRALMSVCSLSHGPLKQEEVQALNPEALGGRHSIEKAAHDLQRLVIGDGRTEGYVFSHPRLGDFVREEMLDETERLQYRRRFLSYGTRALGELQTESNNKTPDYVVRWHSTHLVESGSACGSFKPLLDPRWCAEWERVDGTPAGFLSDLDKVWRQACKADEFGLRIRALLLRASVQTRVRINEDLFGLSVGAGLLSPALAEVMARQQKTADERCRHLLVIATATGGDTMRLVTEALAAARQIADNYKRASALISVTEQLKAQDKEKVLDEALVAARQIRDHFFQAQVLRRTAERLKAEDRNKILEEAVAAARQIEEHSFRATALTEAAECLIEYDRQRILEEALTAARQIGTDRDRASALTAVAARLGTDDRQTPLREALTAARQSGCNSARANALAAMASHMSAEDRQHVLGEALTTAHQITDSLERAVALSAVAARLSMDDRQEVLDQALAAARQTGLSKHLAVSAVAKCLGAADQELLRATLATALEIEQDFLRAHALGEVTQRMGSDDRESLQRALTAARQIGTDRDRASALTAVAARLGADDRRTPLREALTAARRIGDDYERAEALSSVAARLAPKDRDDALRDALATARQIRDEFHRASSLRLVTERLRADGWELLQQALAAARETREQSLRARLLIGVAERFKAEDKQKILQEALAAARQIANDFSRARMLAAVAANLNTEDREKALEDALAAALRIGDHSFRATALWEIGDRLVGDEREKILRQALGAVREIDENFHPGYDLRGLAQRLSSDDRELLTEVLARARKIGNSFYRAYALSAVADRLPMNDRDHALQEALAAARQVKGDSDRVSALVLVAKHLSSEDRLNALEEALSAVRQIETDRDRANALSAVAEHLAANDQQLINDSLATARQIGDGYQRAEALGALAARMDLRCLVALPESLLSIVNGPNGRPVLARLAYEWHDYCRLRNVNPKDELES